MPDLSDAKPASELLMTWDLGSDIGAHIYSDGMVYFGHSSGGVRLEHVLAMVDAYRELQAEPDDLHSFRQRVIELEQECATESERRRKAIADRDREHEISRALAQRVDALKAQATTPEPAPCALAIGDVVRVKGQSEALTVVQLDDGDPENPNDIGLWSPAHGRVWLPAAVLTQYGA